VHIYTVDINGADVNSSVSMCSVGITATLRTVAREELVGPAELLELLGVGRTRLVQLTQRSDFPEPVAELVMGKIWELSSVRAWAEQHGRELHPLKTRKK
jgi:prophage regulatory protein